MRSVDKQRGDTLIEVMLAIAITATVVVMIMGLMNTGLASLQGSIERSQVRSAMQGQLAALQYIRDDYLATRGAGATGEAWKDVMDTSKYLISSGSPTSISDSVEIISQCAPDSSVAAKSFYVGMPLPTIPPAPLVEPVELEGYTGTIPDPLPIAQPGNHMWIEVYDGAGDPRAVNIVVHACWDSPTSGALQHETTVMRLYAGI